MCNYFFYRMRRQQMPHASPFLFTRLKILIAFILLSVLAQANTHTEIVELMSQEQITITGTVRSSNNSPLAGVSIGVQNKLTTVSTDSEGNYSISVASTDILIFSFVGYATNSRLLVVVVLLM